MSEKTPVKLEIEGTYSDDTMYLRMAGATAELPDGRTVEVSTTVGMTGVVVIVSKPGESWRTYFLSAQALASAVLHHEDQLSAKMMEARETNPTIPSSGA